MTSAHHELASSLEYDVAIVGGGLAGCAAAILLAQAGHHVALWEEHHYPRHKMCGEFLSPETFPLLEQLGVWEQIRAERPASIHTARVTEPSGGVLDVKLPQPAIGFSRYRLDHVLWKRAAQLGVTCYEGTRVTAASGSLASGFTIEPLGGEAASARLILGSWGKRSTMDRALARPFFSRSAGFMALKAHFRGPDSGDRTELHAFPGGYCGINRVEGDAVNVCLLATDDAWARGGKAIDPFWAMIQAENPALGRQLAGAERLSENIVISNISFAPRRATEREILMLGDSAALISPLAGNGQAMALRAAFLAAPLVSSFLQGEIPGDGLLRAYERGWRSEFRERLTLGRVLQPLFLHPQSLALALRTLRYLPPVARWLVAGTRERAS